MLGCTINILFVKIWWQRSMNLIHLWLKGVHCLMNFFQCGWISFMINELGDGDEKILIFILMSYVGVSCKMPFVTYSLSPWPNKWFSSTIYGKLQHDIWIQFFSNILEPLLITSQVPHWGTMINMCLVVFIELVLQLVLPWQIFELVLQLVLPWQIFELCFHNICHVTFIHKLYTYLEDLIFMVKLFNGHVCLINCKFWTILLKNLYPSFFNNFTSLCH